MVKEEIVVGLQNAVERGQSLEEAIQTLINAGYDQAEVREASSYVSMGVLGAISAVKEISTSPTTQPSIAEKPKKKIPSMVVILTIILLLLLGGLAVSIFFGEKILNALFGS